MTDITTDPPAEEVAVIPFAAWLQDLRAGRAHAELTDALRELVDAVTTHHKNGELVLKLKIKPAGAGGSQVMVTDDVVVNAPTAERAVSLFYVDSDHNLTRDDPYRPRLPLREVPTSDQDLKEAK